MCTLWKNSCEAKKSAYLQSAVICAGTSADAWRAVIRGPQEHVLHQEHQAILTTWKQKTGETQPLTKHAVLNKLGSLAFQI